jgi:hypothetical protein
MQAHAPAHEPLAHDCTVQQLGVTHTTSGWHCAHAHAHAHAQNPADVLTGAFVWNGSIANSPVFEVKDIIFTSLQTYYGRTSLRKPAACQAGTGFDAMSSVSHRWT